MSILSRLFGDHKVHPEHLHTRADFEQAVLGGEGPVILNVWSPTCAPCRRLAPVLTEVATKHAGRVAVYEVSTESEPGLLRLLGVRSTPTTIMYDRGTEIGRMVGFRHRGWFDEMIEVEFDGGA